MCRRPTGLAPWGAAATSYTYRSTGMLASETRPNGVNTAYTYDTASRLTGVNGIGYVLDANGNRIQMSDWEGVTTYSYDALDRLMQATYPTSTVTYTLDGVGNRLSDGMVSFAYDPSDRITNSGYTYDANGNLLADGTATYEYDAANRLVRTTRNGVVTDYGYDGWGNLIQETTNGVTTEFVLDENAAYTRILGEVRSDGGERLYAYGPEGFTAQMAVGGGIEYPLLDGLGSVRHLTDAGGTVILTRRYDAYGNVRFVAGTGVSRLGYTGELQDSVSGLVYLRARHYYPVLGRFLQRDSFGGFGQRPQSLNRYVYVQNSPLIFVDPSGHYSDEALFTHFACRNWECVKAHFQPGGSHGGLWGWLDVLLKARDGDWVSTYAFFDLGSEHVWSIATGRFITQGGKIKVADVRLNLQFCSYASDAFDNPWDEEQFAKMALTGFRMTGHFAFYNATGTSTYNQQYQDCRHEDCVTPVADGVAAGAATVAAGCALFVGPGSICAGAAGGVSTAASMVGAGTTFYYALNGQASEVDVFVAASTIIVGLGTKSNPYVSAGASIFQAAWDYFR